MAKAKLVLCPKCGGRGVVASATEDVTCTTCDGKGKVPAGK